MITPGSLIDSALEFLERVEDEVYDVLPFARGCEIDHICYRTTSSNEYEDRKRDFSQISSHAHESIVNGRPIAVYTLKKPLSFRDHELHTIELPAPKLGKAYKSGFEHIEIISAEPIELLDIPSTLRRHDQDLGLDRLVELNFSSLNVKIHHLPLRCIIELENNKRVFDAIQTSGIFAQLSTFTPLITGTFPIGIAAKSSDVDIACYSPDLDAFEAFSRAKLSSYDGFEMNRTLKESIPSAVVRFKVDGVSFEISAQAIHSSRQRSYRDMLVKTGFLKSGA